MQADVYKIIELTGTSSTSIEDAINIAIKKASATIKHLSWFEVMQTRGHIEEGKIQQYQVVLKVGFQIED